MKLIPFQTCALITVFSVLVASCKSRTYNDDSKSKGFLYFLNGSDSFDSAVVGKKTCSPDYVASHKILSSPKPTRFFHWTNDEFALNHPFEYMSEIVKKSNKMNDELYKSSESSDDYSKIPVEGVAGAGLYLAPNPFVSSSFGIYLLTFELKPKNPFPTTEVIDYGLQTKISSLQSQIANCPALIYPFNARIIGKVPQDNTFGKAIVLWDLAGIDQKTVLALGPKSKLPENFGPHFSDLFSNREGLQKIIWAEKIQRSENKDNQIKLDEIRKYWAEQPSLYDWE